MALTLRYATHSEIGLVRKNNQDSGYASPNLLLVADGMGGAAAGDLASAVAVATIRQADAPTPSAEMLDVLTRALHRANDRIADLVEADLSLDGMGTTVTGALFDGHDLGLAHIGDSRAYLYRDGRLERLTHDHSWVQSLVDDGKIDEAEAAVHPHRSLLLKVLNGQPANDPDLTRLTLAAGDRLLFCSDGVCGFVDDGDIADALARPGTDEALDRLVEQARAAGGIDNITAIVADVVESGGTVEPVVLGAAAEHNLPTTRIAVGATKTASTTAGATSLDADQPDVEEFGLAATEADGPSVDGSEIDDEARYNPQPPRRRRGLRSLAVLLVLVLVVGAGLGAAWSWTRTQYFVGVDGGQVAIYQGLPDRVVVPLSRVYEVQPLTLASLPAFYAQQVEAGIEVASLESARQTVAELTEAASRCRLARPGPGATTSPGPTTPVPRSPQPTPGNGPSPTAAASTSPGC